MLVLALDTATPVVTAGVVELGDHGPRTLAVRVTVDARRHAEVLTPHVLECLSESGLTPGDLAAVVVGSGPGPFTGLRVGMATGAAFADALGVPLHGVGTLDAIAADAAHPGELLVVTDARRREVYWATYRAGVRTSGPAVGALASVAIAACDAVAGSADHAALVDLPALPVTSPSPQALVAVAAGALLSPQRPQPPVPQYLRRPDAKTLAERAQ